MTTRIDAWELTNRGMIHDLEVMIEEAEKDIARWTERVAQLRGDGPA
jgi:hypothetical protein